MKQGDKTKIIILDTANTLFYQQGFNATSICHIVNETGISKGNITYHFKNKQAILEGIVENRLTGIDKLLTSWSDSTSSPLHRLMLFCDMLLNEQDNLENYGCPMGTLTGELSKNQASLYQITLPMFKRFQTWLFEQFLLLDSSTEQAEEHAMELLSRVQGIAVITHTFKDKDFLGKAIKKLKDEICERYSN